jgi:hypothetical protein
MRFTHFFLFVLHIPTPLRLGVRSSARSNYEQNNYTTVGEVKDILKKLTNDTKMTISISPLRLTQTDLSPDSSVFIQIRLLPSGQTFQTQTQAGGPALTFTDVFTAPVPIRQIEFTLVSCDGDATANLGRLLLYFDKLLLDADTWQEFSNGAKLHLRIEGFGELDSDPGLIATPAAAPAPNPSPIGDDYDSNPDANDNPDDLELLDSAPEPLDQQDSKPDRLDSNPDAIEDSDGLRLSDSNPDREDSKPDRLDSNPDDFDPSPDGEEEPDSSAEVVDDFASSTTRSVGRSSEAASLATRSAKRQRYAESIGLRDYEAVCREATDRANEIYEEMLARGRVEHNAVALLLDNAERDAAGEFR